MLRRGQFAALGSLRLYADALGYFSPSRDIRSHELSEFGGSRPDRVCTHRVAHEVSNLLRFDTVGDRRAQLAYNISRRSRWHHHSMPEIRLKTREPRFCSSGYVWQ